MSRTDALVATMGTLLIENSPSHPFRQPLPPALAAARGWYLPTASGPRALFILPADGMSLEAIAQANAEWLAWQEDAQADESVLLLAFEESPAFDEGELGLPSGGLWQVWGVDLVRQAVFRSAPPDDETPFLGVVDNFLGSFFGGNRLQMSDLEEQEAARVAGRMPFGVFLSRQKAPATWVLLGAIVALYLLTEVMGGSTNINLMWRAGANYRPLVEQGDYWRLISANFLHFGFMHLAVNAYSLYAVGPMLEKLYGTAKYLAIYVLAGLAGAIASLTFNGSSSVGASGALFGLLGAMLVLGLRHQEAIPAHFRKQMRTIALVTLAINLAIGFSITAIDNFAHLGGLVGGGLLAAVLGPSPALLGRRPRPWARLALAAFPVLAAFGVGCGLWSMASGTTPTASVEGPTKDYKVAVPLERLWKTDQELFMSTDGKTNWIQVSSLENRDARPGRGGPMLSEDSLDAYRGQIGTSLASGAQLVEPPSIIQRGGHRFVQVLLATEAGQREEAYLTATKSRLYIFRTKGLQTQPWMRPALERALTTFQIIPPKE